MKTSFAVRALAAAIVVPVLLVQQSAAWGADGHRMINKLAILTLPKDVPEFLRSPATVDAMELYGPMPDHWKSNAEPELSVASAPEHFIDMEYADMIGGPLPRKRYDFIRALAYAQARHPDLPLSAEKVGMQPYAASEEWQKLKNTMRDYREAAASHKETKALECAIVYEAGVLGHFVADGSQPLHASIQYNGWTGANPNNYTTLHTIHSSFESAFVTANVEAKRDVAPLIPAKPALIGDMFDQYVLYLRHSNDLVEPLYKLEKAGGFTAAGSPEGRAFVNERLAAGATELRDLIYTAWVRSGDPVPSYRDSAPAKKKSDE